MTIKECIDIVDNLKPNQYSLKEKVMWLSFIDEIIINDVLKTHEGYDGKYDNFAGYSEDKLSVQLIVASPYDRLYTAYLKMKIDGENGETARYNNSASLFNSYLMEFRKHYNKTHMPLDMTSNKPMPKQCNSASISDAMFESLKRELYYLLSEDFAEMTSRDKLYDIVTSYAINNVQMLKGKDGRDGIDGKDGVDGKDGKDGRDGVDGKDGRNGKDGANGEDYILTDADKDAIVAQVVESLKSTNPSSTVEYYTQDTEGFWNVGYIRTGGTFNTSHASYKCTNLLPINEYTVEEIDILGRSGTTGRILSVAYYKDDKTFISGQEGDRITSVEIPEDAYYMAFTIIVDEPTANNVLKLKRALIGEGEYKNMLTGKKWVACGDSFTQGGSGLTDVFESGLYTGEKKTYPFYIGRRCGMNVVNEAVAGSTMTYMGTREDAFSVSRYQSTEFADADYITLKFGINDAKGQHNAPIGTISDTENTTFYGAWNIVLQHLLTNYPTAHIGIIVTNGGTVDYVNAIIAVAEKWGVPYLNMATDKQVPLVIRNNKTIPSVVREAKDTAFRISESNTHPNAIAHEYESRFIEAWLMTI